MSSAGPESELQHHGIWLTWATASANDLLVTPTPPKPRAFAAALVLLVHVLGLSHSLLAPHDLREDGAVVDTVPLATEAHQDLGGHLCAGDAVAFHTGAADDCLALASWKAASILTRGVALGSVNEPLVVLLTSPSYVAAPLEVLSRAPKASPPQS